MAKYLIVNAEGEQEVRTLTDPRVQQTLDELGIRLVSFADFAPREAAGHG